MEGRTGLRVIIIAICHCHHCHIHRPHYHLAKCKTQHERNFCLKKLVQKQHNADESLTFISSGAPRSSPQESESKVVAIYLFPSSRRCVTHPNAMCAMCQLKSVLGEGWTIIQLAMLGGGSCDLLHCNRRGRRNCLQSPFFQLIVLLLLAQESQITLHGEQGC